MLRPKEDGFNCLIHNDAWCNNFMFKKDSSEIMLLDFQFVRRARPTVDLAYLLVCSASPSFRKENLDGLLSLYYSR